MRRILALAAILAAGYGWIPDPALAQTKPDAGRNLYTVSALTDAEITAALKEAGRVSMSGTFFETDSAKLTPGAVEELAKLVRSLAQMPDARLAVVGHTDNTGNFEYNIELSERRAQAIVDSLIREPFSIEATRLVAVGVGSIDPIASNLSEDGKAQNRRVSFVIVGEAKANTQEAPAAADTESGGWLKDPVTGCSIWTAGDAVPGEGASWTGACHAGRANGRGTMMFWDQKGLEARYTGDVLAGKVHGAGKLYFRNDKDVGYDTFTGHFRNGEPHGKGVLVSSDGYRFEGELIAGISHGKGTLETPQGWMVKGEIKDGKGVGTILVYHETEDKELYFGEAENGKRHGFGTLISANEDSFVGEFENGDPQGPGHFEGADGKQFFGQFAKGVPNGVGTALDPDGTSYQGRFIDGKAEGRILVTKPDGSQTIETWKDGSKVE